MTISFEMSSIAVPISNRFVHYHFRFGECDESQVFVDYFEGFEIWFCDEAFGLFRISHQPHVHMASGIFQCHSEYLETYK